MHRFRVPVSFCARAVAACGHGTRIALADGKLPPPGARRRGLAWPRGFTLLEVMAAVALVGGLAALAVPRVDGDTCKGGLISTTSWWGGNTGGGGGNTGGGGGNTGGGGGNSGGWRGR